IRPALKTTMTPTPDNDPLELEHRKVDSLARALGPIVLRALTDTTLDEVYVNPGGRIWLNKRSQGRTDSGTALTPDQALRFHIVASGLGSVLDAAHPQLQAELLRRSSSAPGSRASSCSWKTPSSCAAGPLTTWPSAPPTGSSSRIWSRPLSAPLPTAHRRRRGPGGGRPRSPGRLGDPPSGRLPHPPRQRSAGSSPPPRPLGLAQQRRPAADLVGSAIHLIVTPAGGSRGRRVTHLVEVHSFDGIALATTTALAPPAPRTPPTADAPSPPPLSS
ncbi:MAG: hypothetical protein M3O15_12530, partial [Acidobacteriota bacterium]|nr:hypothetical protein [Acidobacteriota bacterium]